MDRFYVTSIFNVSPKIFRKHIKMVTFSFIVVLNKNVDSWKGNGDIWIKNGDIWIKNGDIWIENGDIWIKMVTFENVTILVCGQNFQYRGLTTEYLVGTYYYKILILSWNKNWFRVEWELGGHMCPRPCPSLNQFPCLRFSFYLCP